MIQRFCLIKGRRNSYSPNSDVFFFHDSISLHLDMNFQYKNRREQLGAAFVIVF